MKASNLFTPNVVRNRGDIRHVTYIHSTELSERGTVMVSVTPDGPIFEATYEKNRCGAGCFCNAFIAPITDDGIALLASAEKI